MNKVFKYIHYINIFNNRYNFINKYYLMEYFLQKTCKILSGKILLQGDFHASLPSQTDLLSTYLAELT